MHVDELAALLDSDAAAQRRLPGLPVWEAQRRALDPGVAAHLGPGRAAGWSARRGRHQPAVARLHMMHASRPGAPAVRATRHAARYRRPTGYFIELVLEQFGRGSAWAPQTGTRGRL